MKRIVIWTIVGASALAVVFSVFWIRTIRTIEEQWSTPAARAEYIGRKAMNRGVGLVELHRLRHGRYPSTLADLRFLSEFDRTDLSWLEYASTEDGGAYYLGLGEDVPRAKTVTWPPEYWLGTGYDPELKRAASPVKVEELTGITVDGSSLFRQGFAELHLSGVNLAVGQLELHRLRYGQYPERLDDLPFMAGENTGPIMGHSAVAWSNPSLAVIDYVPGEDRLSYEVRLLRPIIGTSSIELPDAYWKGTGYRESREGGA
jgi:hypothetical protein